MRRHELHSRGSCFANVLWDAVYVGDFAAFVAWIVLLRCSLSGMFVH
jgi:hypothetical protein